jgi:GNAT superfamily N-acetyltransferase
MKHISESIRNVKCYVNEDTVTHDKRSQSFQYGDGSLVYFDEILTYPQYHDNALEIETLHAVTKRRGIGSKLIEAIKDYADSERKSIVVYASPLTNDISERDLIKFYKKNGFIQDPDTDNPHCLIYIGR